MENNELKERSKDARYYVLRGSDELFMLVSQIVKQPKTEASERKEFDALMTELVRIRDKCAHLRGTFGYSPTDPRVTSEVEPHLDLVAELAHRCVQVRVTRT